MAASIFEVPRHVAATQSLTQKIAEENKQEEKQKQDNYQANCKMYPGILRVVMECDCLAHEDETSPSPASVQRAYRWRMVESTRFFECLLSNFSIVGDFCS
jgi:hypothetical protein